jgi:hypothetical protein
VADKGKGQQGVGRKILAALGSAGWLTTVLFVGGIE